MKSDFFIFTNLAISMDGKITTRARELFPLGSKKDHYYMDVHRARAHAILMGAGTLRSFQNAAVVQRTRFQKARTKKGLEKNPLNIVISSKLDFNPSWPFFQRDDVTRILAIPKSLSARTLKKFEKYALFFRFSSHKNFPHELIDYLQEHHGAQNLLLEGGGGTIFPFAKENLIDEWNITITPKIVGGETTPTMVDGEGFLMEDIKTYGLKKLIRHKDELFLTYKRLQ